jgi:ATP-binding cassette subfamily B protein
MSVAENVLLRPLREGDDKIVTEALKQSGGYDKIASLKNGINTTLTREFDDEGTVLSGGELQKVELARIFAVPTPFVILDEPSSALDPIAEYKMFENMIHACEHRSSVFISHRLSSATIADHVLLIEDGRIAEEGTHRELMEKNGKYAGMFRMQAENYVEGKVRITEGGAAS